MERAGTRSWQYLDSGSAPSITRGFQGPRQTRTAGNAFLAAIFRSSRDLLSQCRPALEIFSVFRSACHVTTRGTASPLLGFT